LCEFCGRVYCDIWYIYFNSSRATKSETLQQAGRVAGRETYEMYIEFLRGNCNNKNENVG